MNINPKQEFVKSIMSVLRLDDNIYTIGAIEKIIDRLKVSDYQMFIAYLGERKSDYEKPIESIAKGVDEFYNKKLEPHKQKALETQKLILGYIYSALHHCEKKILIKVSDDDIIKENEEMFSALGDYEKKYYLDRAKREHCQEELEVARNDFYSMKREDNFLSGLKTLDGEVVFTEEYLDIVFGIGLENFKDIDYSSSNIIFEYIYTKNVKPSITEQITIREVEKIYEPEQISNKTKEILRLGQFSEWSE